MGDDGEKTERQNFESFLTNLCLFFFANFFHSGMYNKDVSQWQLKQLNFIFTSGFSKKMKRRLICKNFAKH